MIVAPAYPHQSAGLSHLGADVATLVNRQGGKARIYPEGEQPGSGPSSASMRAWNEVVEASHLVGVALVFANEGRIPVMDVLAEFEYQHEMFPLAHLRHG